MVANKVYILKIVMIIASQAFDLDRVSIIFPQDRGHKDRLSLISYTVISPSCRSYLTYPWNFKKRLYRLQYSGSLSMIFSTLVKHVTFSPSYVVSNPAVTPKLCFFESRLVLF